MPPRKASRPVPLADVEIASLEVFFAEMVIPAKGRLIDKALLHALYLDWRDRRVLEQPEESYPILTRRVFDSHVTRLSGAEDYRTTRQRIWRNITLAHPLTSERVTHLTMLPYYGSESACFLGEDWEPPSPLAAGATPMAEADELDRNLSGGVARPPVDPWGRMDFWRRKLRQALLKEQNQRASLQRTHDRILLLANSLAAAEADVLEASKPSVRASRLRSRSQDLQGVLQPIGPSDPVKELASKLLACWHREGILAFVLRGSSNLACTDPTCAHADVESRHAHPPWDRATSLSPDDPALLLICQGWSPSNEVKDDSIDEVEDALPTTALIGKVGQYGLRMPRRPSEPRKGLLRRAVVRCPLCPNYAPWEYAGPSPEACGTFFRLHLKDVHGEVVNAHGETHLNSLVSAAVDESRGKLEGLEPDSTCEVVQVVGERGEAGETEGEEGTGGDVEGLI